MCDAMLWGYPYLLSLHLHQRRVEWARSGASANSIVLTSGGMDPCHIGHTRLIAAASAMGELVVALNSDRWLVAKKGYCFLPLEERMELVAALRGVDHVVSFDDGTSSVAGLIRLLRPDIFAKGGDRTEENMDPEEKAACAEVGCQIVYGVGGDKVQSSSWLVSNLRR